MDKGKNEAFQGHAVVGKETTKGKGERCQDANPANFTASNDISQAKINTYSHDYGQQSEQKLAKRKPKKQALLIVPDFLIDAHFY